MVTAEWSGIFLRQLIGPFRVPGAVRDVACFGVGRHDDSLPTAQVYSDELLLALGMNVRPFGQHPRIIGRLPPQFLLVHRVDGAQVQLVHHVAGVVGQVAFRQPLSQARRQQKIAC